MKELAIPLKKLRVTKNGLNKKLELEEDEYIFCSICDKLQIGVCSVHPILQWVKEPSKVVVTEGLTKARATIPENMELKSSSIPDAGLGIFALERFESDVVFGPYWGEKIGVADVTPNMDQGYMWDIIENGRVTHVVDARDESESNWLRFVNCARNEDEQNLVAFQYRGEIYYRSYKVIETGTELLVWYGDRYACDLDILNKDKKPADGPIQCQKCFMICSGPISLASHNKFRCQMSNEHHLWRCMHCDRSFKNQSSLHFHKNIHKGIKPFPCKLCGTAFSHPASRRRHYERQHSQRDAVSCKICGKVFADDNGLVIHETKCHHRKVYICPVCGQRFTSGVGLSNHKRGHEKVNAQNVCSICKSSFAYSFNLAKHFREKHPTAKIHKCGKCGKFCPDKRRLALHFAIKHSTKHANRRCPLLSSDGHLKERLHPHVKKNGSKQHSEKRVTCYIRCNKCKRTLARNKFVSHMCVRQRVAREDHAQCSRVKREDSSRLPQNRLVEQNRAVKCEFCFKTFPTLNVMHHHRAAHFRKNNPAMPTATHIQPAVSSSESHFNNEHNRKDFPRKIGLFGCNVCGKSFDTKMSLGAHKTHHSLKRRTLLSSGLQKGVHSRKGIGQFRCNRCNKSFLTERSLRSHKTHHGRSSSISPTSSLTKHDVFGRKLDGNKSLCVEEDVSGWKAHKEHLTIPSSGKYFRGSALLTSEPKLFRCDVCGKTFRSKATLQRHKGHHSRANKVRIQDNVTRPYECSTCLEFFHSRGSLSLHRKRMHGKTVATSFICPFCDLTFPSRDDLWLHKQNLHNTADPFICLRCNGRFARKYSRDRHLCLAKEDNEETSIKHEATVKSKAAADTSCRESHECSRCLKSFPSGRSLSNHKRSHAGLTAPCVCYVCHKGLSCKRSLLRHQKSQHSSPVLVNEDRSSSKGDDIDHNSVSKLATCDKARKCSRGGEEVLSALHCTEHPSLKHGIENLSQNSSSSPKVDQPSIGNVTLDIGRKLKLNGECNGSRRKCLYCEKEFYSDSGLKKHTKKKHRKRFAKKDEERKSAQVLKCLYCEKEFRSLSGIRKHIKKTHRTSKATKVGASQGFKQEVEFDTEVISSETADATLNYQQCKFSCLSSGSQDFRPDFSPFNTELSTQTAVGLTTRPPMKSNKPTKGAFKCQYCVKGFYNINSRYKHIMTAHRTNLVAMLSTPLKSSECGRGCTVKPISLKQESRGVALSCRKVIASANDTYHQQRGANAKKTKHTKKGISLGCRFRCRHCSRSFFSKSSRWRHELIVHKKDVGLSSALLGQDNYKTDQERSFPCEPLSEKHSLPDKVQLLSSPFKRYCLSAKKIASTTLLDNEKARLQSVASRYKHVRLVHSGAAGANPKVCRSYPKVPMERDGSSKSLAIGQTVKSDISFDCSTPVLTSSARLKAFQCDHCPKSFHNCSVRYKHYLLVHSRAGNLAVQGFVGLKADPINKLAQPSVPYATAIVNPVKSLVSQSNFVRLNRGPHPDHNMKVVSEFEEDLDSYTCRVCAKLFRSKVDWASHINDEHKDVDRAECRVFNPSRPVLRTISAAFHDNSLRPRRKRDTRTHIKNDKQLSSLFAGNVAPPNRPACLPTKTNIAKKFQCDICLLFFCSLHSVLRHKKSRHCSKRPFQCKICGYAAKREDALVQHKRARHC